MLKYVSIIFQINDGRPELKIGGNGDLEQMQKCLGEILDEENEQQLINQTMADKENNDISTKISEPHSDDLGKYVWDHSNINCT